jgi:hypothetical protein
VTLTLPDAALARLHSSLDSLVTRLAALLDRGDGLRMMVLETHDVDSSFRALSSVGVTCRSIMRVQRPARGNDPSVGTAVTVASFEIDDDPASAPEARLAVAAPRPAHARATPRHPNGAIDLVEVQIAVPEHLMRDEAARYGRYLGRPPRADAGAQVFDMAADQRIRLLACPDVPTPAHGVAAPDGPRLLGFTVTVGDFTADAWAPASASPTPAADRVGVVSPRSSR